MAVFAVVSVPPKNPEKLGEAITTNFGDAYLRLSDESWLVSSAGTAQEVSEKLGVLTGSAGSAVVLGVSGYFGRANPNVWAWLKGKLEKAEGG